MLLAQLPGTSNLRVKHLPVGADSIRIDSLSLLPGSLVIEGVDTGAYKLDEAGSHIHWKMNKRPMTDSIRLQYRVMPFNLTRRYYHKDERNIEKSFAIRPYYYDATQVGQQGLFIDFGNVNYNGSFGRALSFGNSQDVVLNSQFNLQLDGDLGDSIHLTGAITDNTIPFQPDGNTQQIQEFDRVSLQLQRKRTLLKVGDYDIHKPNSYFMNFYKRVQGAYVATAVKTASGSENRIGFGASLAKGKFVRNTITPVEGNQGPYKLTGPNGEQFFIILAGTERVYIDGMQLKRGEEFDYIIDYNTAELTFMPRRIITKDLRIVVEFEFADRNYLNSLIYLNDEWQVNKRIQLRINVYSNQDAKNQQVQQTLDSTRIRFLSSIGDSIQHALYNSVVLEDSFSNSRVLYKKTDTIVNGTVYPDVYVFSTNKDSARYSLSFSFMGNGKGNYKQSVNSTNGRVYAWIAPQNGIPQGEYEPVVVLVTPKKQQMVTLATTYQPDSARQFNAEAAYSNMDPNTFSSIGNNAHHGFAGRMTYEEDRKFDRAKQYNLHSRASYEFVNTRFKPLERFRNVEFARDWNISPAEKAGDEHLGLLSMTLSRNQSGSLAYQFGTYLRGNTFTGLQHVLSFSLQQHGYRLLAKGDLVSQKSNVLTSTFIRPYVEAEKQLLKNYPLFVGSRLLIEHNALKDAASDTLTKTAFSFDALTVYVKNNQDAKNNFSAEYTHRNDRAAKHNAFAQSTGGHTFSLNSNITSLRDQEIRITGAYRILSIIDSSITSLKPDENSLGRIEYNVNTFKGLLTANLLYEFGSGQEQKREFAYVEVPIGQGQYVWRDYNKDSLKQLNEFELAIFPDEKRYIKVFTPTNQYVKAKYSLYNQSIAINPKAIFGGSKLKLYQKVLSLFYLQSAIQLNNRMLGHPGFRQYDPFFTKVEDSILINRSSSVIHSVFFNRFNNQWGVDYIHTITGGRTLLNYGIDSRQNKEHFLRGRWQAGRQVALGLGLKQGTRIFNSPFLENRNYNITYNVLEPVVTFLLKRNQFRIQAGYKFDRRANTLASGGEKSVANNINLDIKYNLPNAGAINTRLTYSAITYNASENSGVAYVMLDGLQRGQNWLWQANFNTRVSKNIEMSFEYEGRKPARGNVVHTGRASVRAIF